MNEFLRHSAPRLRKLPVRCRATQAHLPPYFLVVAWGSNMLTPDPPIRDEEEQSTARLTMGYDFPLPSIAVAAHAAAASTNSAAASVAPRCLRSTRQLRHGFAVWQRRAGFDRHVSFHVLRHSACSAVYRKTKDIRLTQRFARHKSILTTAIYSHPTDEDLLRAVTGLPC